MGKKYRYISDKGFTSNEWDSKKEAKWRGDVYAKKMGEKVKIYSD